MTNQSHHVSAFEIESFCNGLFYNVVRRSDGATVLLQGDDAVRMDRELERTNRRVTGDDVVAQYFD